MNAHPASTEMGWGRGNAPFPSAPSPRTTLGRLHKTLDTPFLSELCLKTWRFLRSAFALPYPLEDGALQRTRHLLPNRLSHSLSHELFAI